MRVWSRDLGEPGISAAQEEGRLAVTLHGCTPLVLASQTVPRLPRPSASRHAHDPVVASLIQRASSFPLNEARRPILTECRRIETSGWRPCKLPDGPATCPTLPRSIPSNFIPLLGIDRHVSANVPCDEGQPTDQRPFQQYEGNVVRHGRI